MYLGIQDIVPEGSCWEKPSICLRFFFSCRLSANNNGGWENLTDSTLRLGKEKICYELALGSHKKPWLLITVWKLNMTLNHLSFFDKVL